jgi:hypothetical protein
MKGDRAALTDGIFHAFDQNFPLDVTSAIDTWVVSIPNNRFQHKDAKDTDKFFNKSIKHFVFCATLR